MKKIYNAPYFKVVEVKNNIIATSGFETPNDRPGYGTDGGFAPGRHGMWDDEFESDDLY